MELIDIYDEGGVHIGVADRNVAHTFGLWHKTVHCWVVLKDGRVVFQRRSRRLQDNPGKLYTTASGHISAGETCETSLFREVEEEVGITPSDPKLITRGPWTADFPKKDGSMYKDRVVFTMYFCRYDGPIESFRFKDGEVDGAVAMEIDDILRLAEGKTDKIPAIEFDGKEVKEIMVGEQDFVLTGHETLESKFATWFRRIRELSE